MWKMSKRATWDHVYTLNQEPYCPVEECNSQQTFASEIDVSDSKFPEKIEKEGWEQLAQDCRMGLED